MRGARPLNDGEVRLMFNALSDTRHAERNLTIFALGISTGFRISEILSLNRGDIEEPTGGVRIRITVQRRFMKGRRSSRTVFVNPSLRETLEYWLDCMDDRGHLQRDAPLFLAQSGRRMSRYNAWLILRTAARSAGLGGRIATHSMRKTFANRIYTTLLSRQAAGEAIDAFRTTSRALGHAKITSTDEYLSFREDDVETAIVAISDLP